VSEANTQNGAAQPRGFAGHVEEVIACTALAVVVGSVAWGVFTRYVTAQPATWSAEIAAVAFCWMIFLGSAAAFKRGLHVSIDMLTGLLPAPLRRALAVIVDLMVLGFLAWTSQLAISFTIDSWDTPMPSLRWPYSIHYAGAALGLVLMTLRHAIAAGGRWRRSDA
jgi:TRAP-type C4-dicarboxylate transport system permease small subunit